MSVEGWPVQRTAERAIVTFPAEVDANNAHVGRSRLMAVIEQDGAKVVIADMTRTTFCDSAGVTALAAARRKAVAHGAAFSLACSSPQILRILELTGLDQILPLFATVDEALGLGTYHSRSLRSVGAWLCSGWALVLREPCNSITCTYFRVSCRVPGDQRPGS